MARQAKGITFPVVYKADLGGLNNAEGALKKFGKMAAGIGAAAVGAITGIAVAGIKSFAEFDSQLQKSVSIMGDVSDAMRDDMANAAREVAKATTFSASEAAESYFFLASAGLDAEQSIAALPKVAAFAQAGMFDMARATDLLTDAQSALGLTSDDTSENLENMAKLGDVLVKANTIANASVEQFASSLTTKAAASMRTLNMEMEEGVAVLAVFADQGIKGEQAGTAFNATMIGLTKNARDNAGAFAALGIEVFDSSGELNNMADIVGQLETGLDGMSTEQVEATLAGLGLSRQALDGTKALLGNSDALREYEEELRNAGGTVEEVAEKQLQTLTGQLALLGSAFEDIGIEVGSILVPIIVDSLSQMGPVIEDIAVVIGDVFRELAPVFADIAAEIPGLVTSLLPLIPVAAKIAEVFFEIVATVLPIFVGLINELMPLIESLIPVLGDVFLGILEAIVPVFLELATALMPIVHALLPVLGNLITALAPIIVRLIQAALPIIDVLLPVFIDLINILTPILLFAARVFEVLLPIAIAVFVGVIEFALSVVEGFARTFAFIWQGVKVFFFGFINELIASFERFINSFIDGFNAMIRAVNLVRRALGRSQLQLVAQVTFGRVEVPDLVPFATGGIVTGPTAALIGEAGPEAVIPLNRFGDFGGGPTYNITVNAGMGTNGADVGREIVAAIKRYERGSGKVFASA